MPDWGQDWLSHKYFCLHFVLRLHLSALPLLLLTFLLQKSIYNKYAFMTAMFHTLQSFTAWTHTPNMKMFLLYKDSFLCYPTATMVCRRGGSALVPMCRDQMKSLTSTRSVVCVEEILHFSLHWQLIKYNATYHILFIIKGLQRLHQKKFYSVLYQQQLLDNWEYW